MSKKIKVYIDTSVWNFALETERPDCLITNELLRFLKGNIEYAILISDLIKAEVDDAHEPRKHQLTALIERFDPVILQSTKEAFSLAEYYISENLIPKKFTDDANHIAIATVNMCEFLVSWNYKHIVRAKTIRGVHLINQKKGYNLIELVSPRELLGK